MLQKKLQQHPFCLLKEPQVAQRYSNREFKQMAATFIEREQRAFYILQALFTGSYFELVLTWCHYRSVILRVVNYNRRYNMNRVGINGMDTIPVLIFVLLETQKRENCFWLRELNKATYFPYWSLHETGLGPMFA